MKFYPPGHISAFIAARLAEAPLLMTCPIDQMLLRALVSTCAIASNIHGSRFVNHSLDAYVANGRDDPRRRHAPEALLARRSSVVETHARALANNTVRATHTVANATLIARRTFACVVCVFPFFTHRNCQQNQTPYGQGHQLYLHGT